jgi:hypothetical protein
MVKGTLVKSKCIKADEDNEVTKGYFDKDGNFVAFTTSGSDPVKYSQSGIGKANIMEVSQCITYGQAYAKQQNDDTYYLGFTGQGSHSTTDKIGCFYSNTDLTSGFDTADCTGETLDGYKTGASGTVGGATQQTALYKFDSSEDPKETKKWYDFIYNKYFWIISIGTFLLFLASVFLFLFIHKRKKANTTTATTTSVPDTTNTTTTDT